MKEITDKDIRQAVKTCQWRVEIQGISVCKGMLGACERVIEAGQCDTLIELFRQDRGAEAEVNTDAYSKS